jgi:hypothetical protein
MSAGMPEALILTALLLGAFVLLGGIYGLLYSLGRLRRERRLIAIARLNYALQCAVTAAIVIATPLTPWWKVFVVLSCAAYFEIPPRTWRYLERLHRPREGHA